MADELIDIDLQNRSYFSIGSGPNDNYRIYADDILDRHVVIRMINDVCHVSEKGAPERVLEQGEIFVVSQSKRIALINYSPDMPCDKVADMRVYPVVEIGRNDMCTLVLKENCVSRRHARVFFAEGRFFVEDLNSVNGTFLNKKRITSSEIHEGDVISVGSYDIKFTDYTLVVGHFE